MRAAKWVTRGTAFGLAVALAAGCSSDSSGGGSSLTPTEKTALAQALFNSDALEGLGPAAGFAGFIFTQIDQVGSLGAGAQAAVNRAIDASISGVRAASYEGAIGMQLIYTVTSGSQSESGTYTGVLGWDGLTVAGANSTVDEAVSAGAATLSGTTPFSSGTIQLNDAGTSTYGIGTYYNRATNSAYISTSGTFSLTGTSFGGSSSDCSVSAQGITVTCSYILGSMSGSFGFDADQWQGTGPATYTQSTINFASLPSVRMTITIAVN